MTVLKTKKAALKRVKLKKNFLIRKKAYKAHLCSQKNSKRLRNLSLLSKISINDFLGYIKMLPYHC